MSLPPATIELSIVVPMYNEQESIRELLPRLMRVADQLNLPYEILCVDDGSQDDTWPRLRALQASHDTVRAIRLSRNYGKEIALTAGADHALGSAIVFMDADLQDPPELIPEFVKHWRHGYQNVYGVRVDRRHDTFLKRSTASLFYRIFNILSDTPMPPHAGDFRLLGPDPVKALRACRERSRFMKGLYSWVGFPGVAIPYERPPRKGGHTSFNSRRLWNLAMDGFISHSTILLRVWTYIGAIVILLTAGLGAWLLGEYFLFRRNPPGFYLTVILILGFSSFNFIMLGIIGEYIGRIYDEVKGRPLYFKRSDDLDL